MHLLRFLTQLNNKIVSAFSEAPLASSGSKMSEALVIFCWDDLFLIKFQNELFCFNVIAILEDKKQAISTFSRGENFYKGRSHLL